MKLTTRETILFALMGAIMYVSKIVMEILPNVHLTAVFIVALTLVYKFKALYPIYVFVFLTGLFSGFQPWWIPYLYIWTVLWALALIIPPKIKPSLKPGLCMLVCALHGLLYGTLYAPFHMLFYGLSLKATLAWIGAGFYWDVVHCVSNFFCAFLVCPIANVLETLEKKQVV